MDDRPLEDLAALVGPLLNALERLAFFARYFNPPDYARVMAAVGEPDAAVAAALQRLQDWPDSLAEIRDPLREAAKHVVTAFEALRAVSEQDDGLVAVFRALHHLPLAQEALYPLARNIAPVSRYFLEPSRRGDAALAASLANADPEGDTGVIHFDNEPGSRGGFSVYVPEYYATDRAWPVVFALHGGSGNGRGFLWSWVRDARSHGAIVVAPTAVGRTWALSGTDADTPNLARILEAVRRRWKVDSQRLLLSGMSDGGTFSYVSGLEPGSPFTHLAPTAAAFHPMLAQFADADRLSGLPIHIVHGRLDWMFEVGMARAAQQTLSEAGARVTYREVEDLSHTYPRELNPAVLDWLRTA